MSGIYFSGVEMPEDGGALCIVIHHDGKVCHFFDLQGGRIATAIPVPPHGRLIDADVICKECRRIAEEYDGIYPDCTYCPNHLAPTIIPADHIGDANEMVTDKEGE